MDEERARYIVKEGIEEQFQEVDVFKVYAEQTSRHPPLSNFLVESNLVKIFGHYEPGGSTSGNSYKIRNSGPCFIQFSDTDQLIHLQLPDVVMTGIHYGTQSLFLQDSMIFLDRANHLKAHLTFMDETDEFIGKIYKYNTKKLKLDLRTPLERLPDIEEEISIIKGNWQSKLLIDDQEVWNIDRVGDRPENDADVVQAKPLPVPNCLPSDSRYREDLIWLMKSH